MPPLMYIKKKINRVIEQLLDGTYDPYWDNVVLLMHMDGTNGSTTFIDEKRHAITVTGDTVLASSNPKFGGSAALFTTSGRLSSAASPDFNLGDTFTIEFWFNPPATISNSAECRMILLGSNGSPSALTIAYTSTYFICNVPGKNSLSFGLGSSVIKPNEWHHYAISVNSGVARGFIDGVLVAGPTTIATQSASSGETLNIGYDTVATVDTKLKGLLDELRITKGVARYLSNFTVPTSPAPGALELDYDWFWDKTILNIRGGNNGAYTATLADTSVNNATLSLNGTLKTVTSTPFSTGTSIQFDGSTDFIYTQPQATAFDVGTTGTWETWFNCSSFTNAPYLFKYGKELNWSPSIQLGLSTSGVPVLRLGVRPGNSGTYWTTYTGSAGAALNTWNHIALTKNGAAWTVYLNGVAVLTANNGGDINPFATTEKLYYIGCTSDGSSFTNKLTGYLSNFRVSSSPVYSGNFTVPTEPLVRDASTQLLIKSGDVYGNSLFKDYSSNNVAITRSGNVTQGFVTPFNGAGGSIYIDGTGQALTASSAALALGSSDFTIESWVYLPSASAGAALSTYNNSAVLGVGVVLGWNANRYPIVKIGSDSDGADSALSPTAVPANTWVHLAAVRQGSSLTLYVNGEAKATTTTSRSLTSQAAIVGAFYPSYYANKFTAGYLSNVRVVNSALYTGNFSTPTAPLTAVPGTQLLLKFDSADIVDETRKNNLSVGSNVSVNAVTKKLGAASVYFSGVGSHVVANQIDKDLNSVDHTVEFWVYPTKSGRVGVFGQGSGSNSSGGLAINITPGSNIEVLKRDNGVYLIWSFALPLNAWTHLAVVRNGTTVTVYANGVSLGAQTDTSAYSAVTYPVTIGSWSSATSDTYRFAGYMDDIRITKGVARYLSNFTPRSKELGNRLPGASERTNIPYDPYWQQVLLMMRMDGSLKDEKGRTVTATGAISYSDDSISGKSIALNLGSTNYLTVAGPADDLNLGGYDFTIEMWVKPTMILAPDGGGARYATLLSKGYDGGASNMGYALYLSSDGVAYNGVTFVRSEAGNDYKGISNTTPLLNLKDAYHHIAAVRKNNIITLYVDGQPVGSSAIGTIFPSTKNMLIGQMIPNSNYTRPFPGYIDDLRITKGVARYSEAFVPARSAVPSLAATY